MTTFDEAARALVWGRELLEDLERDPQTRDGRRTFASVLLVGYPTTKALEARLESISDHDLKFAVSRFKETRTLVTRLIVEGAQPWSDRATRIARHFPRVCPCDAASSENARTWAAHELDRSPGRYGLIRELARAARLNAVEAQARSDGWIDKEGFWCVRPEEELS